MLASAETVPSGPSIDLRHLTKQFGSGRAVDDLSLQVFPGEVVGLLGPNGAGKTTTLRMLAGLITPTSGSAKVCGLEVSTQTLEIRRQLGFLTASTGLYDRLTAREVLTTFGKLHRLAPDRLATRIEQLTLELDLGNFLDRRCGTLSSGQRQRVSIGRAVVHDPAVYVLDEPTSTLDPLASKSILDLVRSVRARGKAVLFSTHRMDEVEYLCDRLYFLREGKQVAEGTPKQILQSSGQTSLTGAFLQLASGEPR